PSLLQAMAAGVALVWQIVTGTPPVSSTRFSIPPYQNITDWPSGENTGFIAGSAPVKALGSISDIDRRYSRPSAAYTIRKPSGDMATACRGSVNCCRAGKVIANRVTAAVAGALVFQSTAPAAPAPIARPIRAGTTRFHAGCGRGWLTGASAAAGWFSR